MNLSEAARQIAEKAMHPTRLSLFQEDSS